MLKRPQCPKGGDAQDAVMSKRFNALKAGHRAWRGGLIVKNGYWVLRGAYHCVEWLITA